VINLKVNRYHYRAFDSCLMLDYVHVITFCIIIIICSPGTYIEVCVLTTYTGIIRHLRWTATQSDWSNSIRKHGTRQNSWPGGTAWLHGHGVSELRQPTGAPT